MTRLAIDNRCVSCGNCEAWLPGLMQHRQHGGLLISEHNEYVDLKAIIKAIGSCHLGFLHLENAS